ncbi:MAG: YajQ family cyclic di-GMP-binding protein [Myxococcales bacterium]|nr:MAG: YajQ family cyclic di-GMP-binding protein [Myxococcales bacterium]
MPSFDVVSKVDWAEFGNALLQAQKEIGQRFDFRNTETSLEKNEDGVVILASAVDRAKAALVVLEEKLVKRKVSLKHLDRQDPGKGPRGTVRLLVKLKEGIETEKAKQIVKLVKDSKLKVQAAIHEDSVRISGKKKDELQETMRLLRAAESLGLDLQFTNFRD